MTDRTTPAMPVFPPYEPTVGNVLVDGARRFGQSEFLVTPDRALRDLTGIGAASAANSVSAPTELLPLRVARREANDAFEREYLALALKFADGNVTRAAGLAEVSRQNLQKLLKKHGRE